MDWDENRLTRLSGITSRDEYRETLLTELQSVRARDDRSAGSDREDLEGHQRPELELDEADASEEAHHEVDEVRLREAIRKEVRAVIEEVLAEKDLATMEKARRNKSVSQALGFKDFATGNVHPKRKNRALARGAGGSIGFGGPGFM